MSAPTKCPQCRAPLTVTLSVSSPAYTDATIRKTCSCTLTPVQRNTLCEEQDTANNDELLDAFEIYKETHP